MNIIRGITVFGVLIPLLYFAVLYGSTGMRISLNRKELKDSNSPFYKITLTMLIIFVLSLGYAIFGG